MAGPEELRRPKGAKAGVLFGVAAGGLREAAFEVGEGPVGVVEGFGAPEREPVEV